MRFFLFAFTTKQNVPILLAGAIKEDKKKIDKISVIDSKRAYNCAIMLGMIKMTFFEIKEAILTVDDDKLEDNQLVQFLNYVPTPEEVKALEPFQTEANKLAASDAFMLEVKEFFFLLKRRMVDDPPPQKKKKFFFFLDDVH